jgi:hypothetical protein
MNSALYLFVKDQKNEFKIGITDNIEDRYLKITSVWGDIDLASSCMLLGDRREVAGLEKTLHFLLDKWRLKKTRKLEGHSEWFSMDCFDKAIAIIDSVATLRDFKLDEKFIRGIPVNDCRKPNTIIKAAPSYEVVANLEEIQNQWPYYKKGTLDFRDHPNLEDTWLWTFDIGEYFVNPFELFNFQHGCDAINLITELFYYTNQPSVIQVTISKTSFSLLHNFDDFKQCREFISYEINDLFEKNRWGYETVFSEQFIDKNKQLNILITEKINGDYTERDRKLYIFLLHAVWGELETKRVHKLSVAEINKVFRELGGDHSPKWIFESAKRLAKTTIEWEIPTDGEWLQRRTSLLSFAFTDKDARDSGYIQFGIPAGLIPVVKTRSRFTQLQIHFMLGLSGKYAVTLYEILESVANIKNPALEVDLLTLRRWLKIADSKLENYADLRRLVLEPALKQINDNPEGAGFSVEMEPIKRSHAVERIRFTLTKTAFRTELEGMIKRAKAKPAGASGQTLKLSTATYEKAKKAAPSFDIYYLETEWRTWAGKQKTPTANPDGSFISFCTKKQKSASPSAR